MVFLALLLWMFLKKKFHPFPIRISGYLMNPVRYAPTTYTIYSSKTWNMRIFTMLFLFVTSSFALTAQSADATLASLSDTMVSVPATYLAQLERTYGVMGSRDVAMRTEEETDPLMLDIFDESAAPFQYQIFPQRTSDYLQLDLPEDDDFVLRVFDRSGKVMISHDQLYGYNQLNVKHLPSGIYRVRVTSSAGVVEEWIAKEE